MNRFLTAIALTIALPAVAHAQAAPAPAPKSECCEKMKDCCKDKSKMDCCKGMDHSKMDHGKHDMKAGADAHAGHDMSGAAAQPDSHQNHQQ
jgi:hypothetical protein